LQQELYFAPNDRNCHKTHVQVEIVKEVDAVRAENDRVDDHDERDESEKPGGLELLPSASEEREKVGDQAEPKQNQQINGYYLPNQYKHVIIHLRECTILNRFEDKIGRILLRSQYFNGWHLNVSFG
jgi:hypothetical protein